jgi:valyl-tRNA synthetase
LRLDNIRDRCISRQLRRVRRIPAWYCRKCWQKAVSRTDPESCPACGSPLLQDEDVLDTWWFSSGLRPFSTLGWPDRTRELERYYPTSVLVTGFDIIALKYGRLPEAGIPDSRVLKAPKQT